MTRLVFCLFTLLFLGRCPLRGQSINLLYKQDSLSFRGLSAVGDSTVWVSGNRGTVGRSVDGGNSWRWTRIEGHETRDFRDIHAFNASRAVVMAVGEPALILLTTDGGLSWTSVFKDNRAGMFLDAMHFSNERNGIVAGDPVNGHFFLARTADGGSTWTEADPALAPLADSNEACFAASGTNVYLLATGDYYLVSGGARSRLRKPGSSTGLPVIQGTQSTGANSLAVYQQGKQIMLAIAGGDFAADSARARNCFISPDGGRHWKAPVLPPAGYRSCIAFLSKTSLVACGTSGVDISSDQGMHWTPLSTDSYHVIAVSPSGRTVYLAGAKGKIARFRATISPAR